MALDLLTRRNLPQYKQHLEKLQEDTRPQWGTMDAARMVSHLAYCIRLSLGEVDMTEVKDHSKPILRTIAWLLFFNMFTDWPKGTLTAPAYFYPAPKESFLDERNELITLIERFVAAADKEPNKKALSPLLGPMRLSDWTRIHGVHFQHHFRQFGLI